MPPQPAAATAPAPAATRPSQGGQRRQLRQHGARCPLEHGRQARRQPVALQRRVAAAIVTYTTRAPGRAGGRGRSTLAGIDSPSAVTASASW